MKHLALYKAIVFGMGIAGVAGLAMADEQAGTPVTVDGATLHLGSINVTPGGFVDGSVVYRNRNEVADVGTKLQPLPNITQDAYHTSDFRMSGRSSRLGVLIQGPDRDGTKAEAYYEADFLGAGVTSNSVQSNSYVLRTRQAFGSYTTGGLQVLAGQAWSLVTQNKKGISARGENIPQTIDSSYVVGFNYTRNAQLRLTTTSDILTAALSFEGPQAIVAGSKPAATPAVNSIVTGAAGGSQLNSTATYSTDALPDVIGKVAVDPAVGHFEALVINRHFRDRVDPSTGATAGSNAGVSAVGYGASALVAVVPKLVDVQASFLGGKGIGRYGASNLPDYTYKADGTPRALRGYNYLAGVVVHAAPELDLYAYLGQEKVKSATDGAGAVVGYGASNCTAFGCNVRQADEFTVGGWYKFYQGKSDHAQVGLQWGHIRNEYFGDSTDVAAHTTLNQVIASVRYFPFSK